MRRMLLLFTLVLVAAAGCSNAGSLTGNNGSDNSGKSPKTLRAVAELEYVNHAWGYSHNGVVIRSDGSVDGYQFQHGGTPWPYPEGATVSEAQLEAKYAVGRTQLGQVSADTVALIAQLVEGASKGAMSERICMGADMGQHERIAYTYDAASKVYTKVSLRINGDCDLHNTAPHAVQLADIIDAIVGRFR